ncbi:hypothetical protein M0804_013778 [Polistes exclamans]|nr:hypothetical protein M0804_013778 [Polistes exclamans]
MRMYALADAKTGYLFSIVPYFGSITHPMTFPIKIFHIATIGDSLFDHLKNQDTLQAPASILRNEIMKVKKSKLLDNLSSQRLIQGEYSIPLTVSDFVGSIIGSYNRKRQNCDSFKLSCQLFISRFNLHGSQW